MYQDTSIYYPVSERHTQLIPVTIGCAHKKCTFCAMYENCEYGEVPLQDIEEQLRYGNTYTERVFLTGADPLHCGFERMMKVLKLIRKHLPYCATVAAYASVRSIAKYSLEELKALHENGLNLLYIGFESGDDEVLKAVRKGHTVAQAVEQAKKLNVAKIPFNCIVMYGIAGKGRGEEHARKTAEMVNQFACRSVVTMNLTLFDSTPLAIMQNHGEFEEANNAEKAKELHLLLELLNPQGGSLFDSTHPTNYLKVQGHLPEDREKMLKELESQW